MKIRNKIKAKLRTGIIGNFIVGFGNYYEIYLRHLQNTLPHLLQDVPLQLRGDI